MQRGILYASLLASSLATLVSCRVHGIERIALFVGRPFAPGERIRVVNWNTQKGANGRLRRDLETMIEERRPDLVFIQEGRRDFPTNGRLGGYFGRSWRFPGWGTVGLLTLSRSEPLDVELLPTRFREFFVTAPKVSMATRHALGDGTVLLAVNAHCLAFERWGTLRLRAQLRDLRGTIARHDGPVLLCGDFNTWNRRRLDLVRSLARELDLEEIRDFPEGRRTGDLRSGFWNRLLGVDPALPLDRIYYRGLEVLDCGVLDEYSSSDHAPLYAEFLLES